MPTYARSLFIIFFAVSMVTGRQQGIAVADGGKGPARRDSHDSGAEKNTDPAPADPKAGEAKTASESFKKLKNSWTESRTDQAKAIAQFLDEISANNALSDILDEEKNLKEPWKSDPLAKDFAVYIGLMKKGPRELDKELLAESYKDDDQKRAYAKTALTHFLDSNPASLAKIGSLSGAQEVEELKQLTKKDPDAEGVEKIVRRVGSLVKRFGSMNEENFEFVKKALQPDSKDPRENAEVKKILLSAWEETHKAYTDPNYQKSTDTVSKKVAANILEERDNFSKQVAEKNIDPKYYSTLPAWIGVHGSEEKPHLQVGEVVKSLGNSLDLKVVRGEKVGEREMRLQTGVVKVGDQFSLWVNPKGIRKMKSEVDWNNFEMIANPDPEKPLQTAFKIDQNGNFVPGKIRLASYSNRSNSISSVNVSSLFSPLSPTVGVRENRNWLPDNVNTPTAANIYQRMPVNIPTTMTGNSLLSDDANFLAHEGTHTINKAQSISSPGEGDVQALYDPERGIAILHETGIPRMSVANFIPASLRSYSFNTNVQQADGSQPFPGTYIVNGVPRDGDALYLWNEWTAYINGVTAKNEQKRAGRDPKPNNTEYFYPLEYTMYSAAAMEAVATARNDKSRPYNYGDYEKMRKLFQYNAERAMKAVKDNIQLGSDPRITYDYLSSFRSTQLYNFLVQTYGAGWVNRTFSLDGRQA